MNVEIIFGTVYIACIIRAISKCPKVLALQADIDFDCINDCGWRLESILLARFLYSLFDF